MYVRESRKTQHSHWSSTTDVATRSLIPIPLLTQRYVFCVAVVVILLCTCTTETLSSGIYTLKVCTKTPTPMQYNKNTTTHKGRHQRVHLNNETTTILHQLAHSVIEMFVTTLSKTTTAITTKQLKKTMNVFVVQYDFVGGWVVWGFRLFWMVVKMWGWLSIWQMYLIFSFCR